jgi:hypothetical protein
MIFKSQLSFNNQNNYAQLWTPMVGYTATKHHFLLNKLIGELIGWAYPLPQSYPDKISMGRG